MIKNTYNLKTGNKNILIDTLNKEVELILHQEPERKISPDEFRIKLSHSIKKNEISDKQVLIIIADKTRLCGYSLYLPVINSFLAEQGAKNIRYMVAYGTHQNQTKEESLQLYGSVYHDQNFIHPSLSDTKAYIDLGKTLKGTPVQVRKEIFEAELLITFGAISHHYFAGYGGGRKLLFPGLATKESIYHNHSLFLDKKNRCLHDKCRSGRLDQNPVAEDLKEIDSMMPPKISIYGILNSKEEVCELEIGRNYGDFEKKCREYDKFYKINHSGQFDMVIASCGGYPKDINFIQSHKSIHNAAVFVKEGGNLLIFAECKDGIGSDTFLPYFKMGYNNAFLQLCEHYEGNGGTALSMMEKTKKIRISIHTLLNQEICNIIGIKKIENNEITSLIKSVKGNMAIIENAGLIVKK